MLPLLGEAWSTLNIKFDALEAWCTFKYKFPLLEEAWCTLNIKFDASVGGGLEYLKVVAPVGEAWHTNITFDASVRGKPGVLIFVPQYLIFVVPAGGGLAYFNIKFVAPVGEAWRTLKTKFCYPCWGKGSLVDFYFVAPVGGSLWEMGDQDGHKWSQ